VIPQTKIVACISGGNLQSVFASTPEIDFELIDADNLLAEGKSNAEIDEILKAATNDLYPVY